MTTKNIIIANFPYIVNTDANGSIVDINVPGNITAGGNINGTVDVANVTGIGNIATINLDGNVGNVLRGDGSWDTADVSVSNANYANFAGTAYSVAGANVSGDVSGANHANIADIANVAYSVDGANVSGVVANASYSAFSGVAASANSVTGANVSGDVAGANHANIADVANVAYSVDAANVSGVVANANYSAFSGVAASANSVAGANVSGTVANANYSAFSGVASSADSVAGANVVGAVANAVSATYSGVAFSVSGANVVGDVAGANHANVANVANSVSGANVVGDVTGANYANYAGNVTISAQPNITSLGTLTSLDVSGNTSVVGTIIGSTIEGNNSGVTITATGVDQNIVLQPSGNGTVSASGAVISDLGYPVNSTDAASKAYVDAVATGLHIHSPAQAATTADLATMTGGTVIYNNGVSGVGATLTLSVALTTIDTTWTLSAGERVLVKNEVTNPEWNGIYVIDGTGLVLTRALDSDSPAELAGGDFVFVEHGQIYAGSGWVIAASITTVGTDPVIWEQFSAAGAYSAGTGLTLLGGAFSITNTTVTAGNYGNARTVPSITVNQQGQLTSASQTEVIANAETLDGTTLKSSVIYSSLTTVGTLQSLAVTGDATAGNMWANSGTIGASLLTGTLTTAAQPNITSLGTLSDLTVTGNITAGNVNAGNVLYANYLSGNGYALSDVNGSNVFGTVANANYSAYSGVATSADSVAGANVSGVVANANYAAYAGTVTGAAQSNITSVGTLTGLTVNGVSNLGAVGNVKITGGVSGDALTTDGTGNLNWQTISFANTGSNAKYVSKNGNDTTGDGSMLKPYLTITAAMNSITDAAPTKRYAIYVNAGEYNEGATLSLKPNVFVVGCETFAVRIVATTFNMNAGSWTGTSDHRSGFSNCLMIGACDWNWATVTSGAGKLYFYNVQFSGGTVNLYGHNNATAQAQHWSCVFFSAMTVSGINIGNHMNCRHFANITLTQHPGGGMATILNAAGGDCSGTVSLVTTVTDFNRRCSGFFKSFYMGGLTVNGASSYADVTNDSLPSAGPTVLNGGNVVYLNSSGATTRLNNLVYPTAVNSPIMPATSSATNLGDWGKQWAWTFSYVYGSTGSDLYVISYGSAYAADTVGRNIGIYTDGAGLATNVDGGNIDIVTSDVTGTADSGKITLSTGAVGTGARGNVDINTNTVNINGKLTVSGNANVGNIGATGVVATTVAGSLTTAAQPNITSVGTLTGLTVAGNVLPSANITYNLGSPSQRWNTLYLSNNTLYLGDVALSTNADGDITVDNVVVATYGNGNIISGTAEAANVAYSVDGSNVSGDVSGANYANYAGTVLNASQPNITSVGTLSGLTVGGDATVTGNLNVSGSLTYIDVTNLRIQDPVIQLGGGPNGAPLTTNDGRDRGTYLHVFDTGANAEVDKFMGWHTSNGEFAFGSNVTVANDVVTFNSYGNLRADTFIGSLQGTAANASYADDANIARSLVNGTSSISIPVADSNVEVRVDGIMVIDSNAVQTSFLANTVNVQYDLNVGNRIYANSFETSGNITASIIEAYGSVNTAFLTVSLDANFYENVTVGNNLLVSSTLDVTGSANVGSLNVSGLSNLGDVSNVTVTGGSTGQAIITDGNGNLSWANIAPDQQPIIEFTANGTGGSGQSFINGNLASFTNNTYAAVYVNGVLQRVADYTISGATLTFNGYLAPNAEISVGPLSGYQGSGGGGVDIGDFIFSGRVMTVSGSGEDLSIKAPDDLYLDALGDDIHIRADDDIRIRPGYNFTTDSYSWEYRFNSGDGILTISNSTNGSHGQIEPINDGNQGLSLQSDGNIYIKSAGGSSSWVFDNAGNLTTPGTPGTYIKSTVNGFVGLAAIDGGVDLPAQLVSINYSTGLGTTAISAYASSAQIQANINGDIKSWIFDSTGNLTLPGNTFSVNYSNGTQVSLDSNTLYLLEAYSTALYTLPGSFTIDVCRYDLVNNVVNVSSSWFDTTTHTFTPQKAGYWQITACYDVYRGSTNEASILIRKNGSNVAVSGGFGTVNATATKLIYLNGTTDSIQVVNSGSDTQSRQQDQARSWFQAKWISE